MRLTRQLAAFVIVEGLVSRGAVGERVGHLELAERLAGRLGIDVPPAAVTSGAVWADGDRRWAVLGRLADGLGDEEARALVLNAFAELGLAEVRLGPRRDFGTDDPTSRPDRRPVRVTMEPMSKLAQWAPGVHGKGYVHVVGDRIDVVSWSAPEGVPHHAEVMMPRGLTHTDVAGMFTIDPRGRVDVFADARVDGRRLVDVITETDPRLEEWPDDLSRWDFR